MSLPIEIDADWQAARIKQLEDACAQMNGEVCDILGRVLGYPWYKDDQKNFPGATEKDGVCVGEQVAESIAAEAAEGIEFLTQRANDLLAKNVELEQRARKAEREHAALEQLTEANLLLDGYRQEHRKLVEIIKERDARIEDAEAQRSEAANRTVEYMRRAATPRRRLAASRRRSRSISARLCGTPITPASSVTGPGGRAACATPSGSATSWACSGWTAIRPRRSRRRFRR